MKLSLAHRIKRRIWLTFATYYVHPDGTTELDIEEKAGIVHGVDDEATAHRKFDAWNRRESMRELRWQWFLWGAITGGTLVYWWLG
jgi:hypothetical protein